MRKIVSDPQTSGGLLVSCRPEDELEVLRKFQALGFSQAQTIGSLITGDPSVEFV
jgi:selenide,water dikinase